MLHVVLETTRQRGQGRKHLELRVDTEAPVPVTQARLRVSGMYGLGDFAYVKLVQEALGTMGFRPDVIHCNITLPTGLAALWLRRVLQVPCLLTEHTGDYMWFYGRRRLTLLKARMVLRGVDMVMPVSEGQGQLMTMSTLEPRGRYTVVPNAVDPDIFSPGPARSPDGTIRALTVGSLLPVKGHEYLLRAYARLSEESRNRLHILIVGDGSLRDDLLLLRAELGIDEGVTIESGGRPRSEIARLMRDCSFYVQPSVREATPCVIVESMACGKPVLATRCGGSEYLVGPETGVVVEKADVDALVGGLQAMIERYHLFDSELITRHASEKYSYEAVGGQYDEIYRSITAVNP